MEQLFCINTCFYRAVQNSNIYIRHNANTIIRLDLDLQLKKVTRYSSQQGPSESQLQQSPNQQQVMQDQQEGMQREKHVVYLTAPHYIWRQLNLGGQQNCGTKETNINENMSKQKSRKKEQATYTLHITRISCRLHIMFCAQKVYNRL